MITAADYQHHSTDEQIKVAVHPRVSADAPPGASQVGIIGSAADGGVDGAGCGALCSGERHIIIQGVFGVGHAAADAAPGPVQARSREASGHRLRLVVALLQHLLHPPLPAVLAAAAAADPEEHDETGQDLKDPADEAQDDAVSDAHVRERRGGRDRCEEVGVPGDRDDGEDARDEDQQASQAGHRPVGVVFPAADARDGHNQADDGDH